MNRQLCARGADDLRGLKAVSEPSEREWDEARAIAQHVSHMLAGCSAIPDCELCDQQDVHIVRAGEYGVGAFCRDCFSLGQLLVKSLRQRWLSQKK